MFLDIRYIKVIKYKKPMSKIQKKMIAFMFILLAAVMVVYFQI